MPDDLLQAEAFWRWAYSDFLSNAQRGVLAEYIVAQAAGSTGKGRVEWAAWDLERTDGLKIEVKSSGYLQTWSQQAPSLIKFDIAEKRGWNPEANAYAVEASRAADLYVFCVFNHQDRETANPLDLQQWFFLTCRTEWLTETFKNQKSVSLSRLEAAGLKRLSFVELKRVIGDAAN